MSEINNIRKMEIAKFDDKLERFAHSNRLIEARYSLSPQEQRIILTMVSMIMPSDQDSKEYVIPIKDFAEFFNIKGASVVANLKRAAKSLIEKSIVIQDENKTLYASWISSAEFPEKENHVALCFDPKLKPYLLQLKEQYTFLENRYLVQLKSFYSIRIYMLLKQYINLKKERKFEVNELRLTLGIKPEEYKNYFDFKTHVIIKASTDINNKTDLFISFEEKKTGKKVTHIIFNITEKNAAHKAIVNNGEEEGGKPKPPSKSHQEKNNLERNIEAVKKYFGDNNFRSDPQAFYDYYEIKNWKGVASWTAAADAWNRRYEKLNPATQVIASGAKPIEESQVIKDIRAKIKFIVGNINFKDLQYFYGEIESTEDRHFVIFASDKRALKYEAELAKINVMIEVK